MTNLISGVFSRKVRMNKDEWYSSQTVKKWTKTADGNFQDEMKANQLWKHFTVSARFYQISTYQNLDTLVNSLRYEF